MTELFRENFVRFFIVQPVYSSCRFLDLIFFLMPQKIDFFARADHTDYREGQGSDGGDWHMIGYKGWSTNIHMMVNTIPKMVTHKQ